MKGAQKHAAHAQDARNALARNPSDEFLKHAVTYHELQAARHTRMECMTDIDRLIAAADALEEEAKRISGVIKDDHGHAPIILSQRLTEYRAAREAITKGATL